MYPFLQVMGRSIPVYGICIIIGIVLGYFAISKRCKNFNIEKNDCLYASLFAVIGLIIGGKILYILTIFNTLIKNANNLLNLEFLKSLFEGGFVFYGGLIGAGIMVFIYAKQYNINIFNLTDSMVIGVPLAYGIGRIGCFMAGCCYGIPSHFGLYFNNSYVAPHGIRLVPIQLIDSCLNIIFFFILFFIVVKFKRCSGKITGIYLIFYSITRFVLEFFRYDNLRGIIFSLSLSQWISIIVLIVGLYLLIKKRKKFEKYNKF